MRWYVVAILLFYVVTLSAYSLIYSPDHIFDVTLFVHAGDKVCTRIDCTGLYVFGESYGYDGQYYHAIAKDILNPEAFAKIHAPYYRHQRILYPLLASVLALGSPQFIPYTLLAVNLLAVTGLILISSKLFKDTLSRMYAPILAGVALSVLLDVAEPLWFLLSLSALYYMGKEKHRLSCLLFCLAILVKETTLFLLLPAAVYKLSKKEKDTVYYAAPFAVLALWQLILYFIYGVFPLLEKNAKMTSLTGYVDSLTVASTSGYLPSILILAALPAILYVSVHAFKKERSLASTVLAFNAFSVYFFDSSLWVDVFAASRNILPLSAASLFYLSRTNDRRTHLFLAPQLILSFAVAAYYAVQIVV